jgi:hypothetical protein
MHDLSRQAIDPTAFRGGMTRRLFWLMLVAASVVHGACFDFTLPPQTRDAYVVSSEGGAGGSVGSGGQSGTAGAASIDAGSGDDAVLTGWGGTVASGHGGHGDLPVPGTGGAVEIRDAFAGDSGSARDDVPGDPLPDAPVDVATPDVSADASTSTLSLGLVAYYPCERAQGTTLRDQSGHGNNGTLQIAPATAGAGGSAGGSGSGGGAGASGLHDGYKFEAGKIGNGLTLVQAGSGYVSIPATMFNGAREISIATWIRINTLTTWQRLFDFGINANAATTSSTATYINLVLRDLNGKLGLNSTKTGYIGEQRVTAEVLPTGVWKHIAVIFGGGAATLYVDGMPVGLGSTLALPADLGTIDYAFIGKSQFGSDPLADVEIDEFRVYDRALSASEVQALVVYDGS